MRIVSIVSALFVLCSTLAVPAMATEVWVVDLDSSPVMVSETGNQTPVASAALADPDFTFLDPEPDLNSSPATDPPSGSASSPAPELEDDLIEIPIP